MNQKLTPKFKKTISIMSKYNDIKKNDNTLTDKEALVQAIREVNDTE